MVADASDFTSPGARAEPAEIVNRCSRPWTEIALKPQIKKADGAIPAGFTKYARPDQSVSEEKPPTGVHRLYDR